MLDFSIKFDPEIPSAKFKILPPPEYILDRDIILKKIPQLYNIIYLVGEEKFAYYPADIGVVMGDLYFEWECAKKRLSHLMSLSGYTVLEVVYKSGSAEFFDPADFGINRKPISGLKVDPINLENSFRDAAAAVWELIKT